MEDDKWCFRFSASAGNHRSQPTPKYPFELEDFSIGSQGLLDSCIELEDIEGDDEMAMDYPCSFCAEDYDLVELCHHIDEEHYLEAYSGICPVCARRVKMNMVDHITAQHKSLLKSEQRHRIYKDESYSPFSLRTDKYLHSLPEESPSTNRAAKSVPDPLVSFIRNLPLPNESKSAQPGSSTETSTEDNSLNKDSSKKDWKLSSPLSDTEQMEKAKKCEFVQGLLSSIIFQNGDF